MRWCHLLASLGLVAAHVEAKAVFAHFMVGNTKDYSEADWQNDMRLAQEAHIDGFALNIANEAGVVRPLLDKAFWVANNLGFKLIFSYDYAGLGPFEKQTVIDLCNDYCNNGAYYRTGGKPLLTTFEGPERADDWHDIKAATGGLFLPDWSSKGAKAALELSNGVADGLFSWAAWPWGDQDMNTYVDASYKLFLNGKPYMMPASPWFYTNLPGYGKNWLWRGDDMWFDRWNQIIFNQPEFVQLISWNDYGESHYIGPLMPGKAMEAFTIGRAPFNYVEGYPHDGWRAFLPYVIDLYKNGQATITKEGVVGWWRRSAANACEDGRTTGNTASQLLLEFPPSLVMQDKIFFSALLGSDASVSVTVGGVPMPAAWTDKPDGDVGIYHGHATFTAANTGDVVITVSRGSSTVAAVNPGASGVIGTSSCVGGLTNWNAFVDVAWAAGSITATPTLTVEEMGCIKGTGIGNFKGLCEFLCERDYCPVGACLCQAMGSPRPEPSTQFPLGYPAPGLDENYSGLCAEACRMGYCPTGICAEEPGPLTTPTVSPFTPPACTSGTGSGELEGLCNYACTLGFCPSLVCQCTSQGPLNVPPQPLDGASGKPRTGLVDEGLCNFACSRGGYCPPSTCQNTTKPAGPGGSPGGDLLDLGAVADGSNCRMTRCLDSENLKKEIVSDGWQSPSSFFRDDCPEGQYRLIQCPEFESPSDCRWSGSADFCNDGCDLNEIPIAYSKNAGKGPCKDGRRALCCKSNTWSRLVGTCEWVSPASGCPGGKVELAQGQIGWCARTDLQTKRCMHWQEFHPKFCCNPGFDRCTWAEGCSRTCGSNEIVASIAAYDTVFGSCRARRAVCCKIPTASDAFLHVPLDWLFPTLPPADYRATFTMDNPDSKLRPPGARGVAALQPFGFVVIDGPPDKVISFDKRDGSHMRILDLDCDPAVLKHQHNETYTARFVCMDDSADSNCDDIHLGGAEGTIVKLPSDCGFAGHGVVHTIEPATDRDFAMSHDLRARAPPNATVHELSFSYDFSRVKRAEKSDPIYVRIDYGTQNHYWHDFVDEPADTSPATRRKRNAEATAETRAQKHKRFWSSSDQRWQEKFNRLRSSPVMEYGENQLISMSANFDRLVYQQTSSGCSQNGFLSVHATGNQVNMFRMGITVVGTISPTLRMEEAHAFFDTVLFTAGSITVDGKGTVNIPGTTALRSLFPSQVSDWGYKVPGIVDINPRMDLKIQMAGSGFMDGKFQINFLTTPDQPLRLSSVKADQLVGKMAPIAAGVPTHSDSKIQARSDDGGLGKRAGEATPLSIRLFSSAGVDLKVFKYGSEDVMQGDLELDIEILRTFEVRRGSSGRVTIVDQYGHITSSAAGDGDLTPGWPTQTYLLESFGGAREIFASSPSDDGPPSRNPPNLPGVPVYDSRFNFMGCGTRQEEIVCRNLDWLSANYTHLSFDNDEEGDVSEVIRRRSAMVPGSVQPHLEPRATGAARNFDVPQQRDGQNTFRTTSSTYPTGNNGQFLANLNQAAGFYNLADADDCENPGVVSTGDQNAVGYHAEHIIEENTVPEQWSFMMTGQVRRTSMMPEHNEASLPLMPVSLMGQNSVFTQPWSQWDSGAPPGTHPDANLSPEREMWDLIGSFRHPQNMVNAHASINMHKMRMVRGQMALGEDFWVQHNFDDTSEQTGVFQATEAMSFLRLYTAVFTYLNDDTVHAAMERITQGFAALFQRFDDRLRATGRIAQNGPRSNHLYRRYLNDILLPRIEASSNGYFRLIDRLRANWNRARSQIDPTTQGPWLRQVAQILTAVDTMRRYAMQWDPTRENASGLHKIKRDGLPPPPP
ncbi:carbohydrate-binding module family 24 protein [Parathielavia hyrcaniae]|uniref:Carbohydrate-binding module family 24 protein n=1 Tax=Parathielavia hyrcaniae TaxID=113614 RepID=A0AAN6T6G3_9PEZI|nr:carbohydrate-binding module family 24 protein [Parathielavia hyrcaniae]